MDKHYIQIWVEVLWVTLLVSCYVYMVYQDLCCVLSTSLAFHDACTFSLNFLFGSEFGIAIYVVAQYRYSYKCMMQC